jgi:hypothetical protein
MIFPAANGSLDIASNTLTSKKWPFVPASPNRPPARVAQKHGLRNPQARSGYVASLASLACFKLRFVSSPRVGGVHSTIPEDGDTHGNLRIGLMVISQFRKEEVLLFAGVVSPTDPRKGAPGDIATANRAEQSQPEVKPVSNERHASRICRGSETILPKRNARAALPLLLHSVAHRKVPIGCRQCGGKEHSRSKQLPHDPIRVRNDPP